MVRLAISVEGLTEERFAKEMLVPHLQKREIYVVPKKLGRDGGGVSLPRVRKDLNKLAHQFDKVTTMYDFYGFRGKDPDETKATLEQKILNCVSGPLQGKIMPYVQMHEFEGLLFSSPEAMENGIQQAGTCKWAQGVLGKFGGDPEKINDSTETAPSKRLSQFCRGAYVKSVQGLEIAEEIGLDVMRQKCLGFGDWLAQLERL